MQSGTTNWRQDWVIDPDPLAAAQARHLPSGFGVNLKTITAVAVAPGQRPFVATIASEDSRPVIDELFPLGFDECRAQTAEMQEQARSLWVELGLDVDPTRELNGEQPCRVHSWRDDWVVDAGSDGLDQPVLVHSAGLAAQYVYTEVDEDSMGWCSVEPAGWHDRIAALKAKITEQQLERLWQEASILWLELGYFDSLPTKVSKPFGDDWRSLWQVREEGSDQWIVHISGLAVTPVFGVVDEEGFRSWPLHVKDYKLDSEMRQRVGDQAWQRVHDQGWQLCVELGYVRAEPTAAAESRH